MATPRRGRPTREQVYRRLEAAAADLRRAGGLPSPREAKSVWDNIWHLEAHNSTAIEGNTLVLREVQTLLDTGRAVGAKDLKDFLEVRGYGAAAQWVYAQALDNDEAAPDEGRWKREDLITVTEIRAIHDQVMSKVWVEAPHPEAGPNEGPGSFRRHDIQPFGGGMTPPPWTEVPSRLRTWVDQAVSFGVDVDNEIATVADLPPFLAEMHGAFERIHPFIDGNGRTGRLVLNLLLVRLGWPPAIIYKRDRDKYLRALDRADGGDPGPLAELIARSIVENVQRLVLPNLAGPARTVPLQSLTDERITYTALRAAATRGRLDAYLETDGTWRSTRHAVDAYLAARYRRPSPARPS